MRIWRCSRLLFGAAALLATVALPVRADDLQLYPFAQMSQGRLGVRVQAMTPELREYFGAPGDRGVLVSQVGENSPAAAAGLLVGDVILLADGRPVRQPVDLRMIVGATQPTEDVVLVVLRDRQEHKVRARPRGIAAPWLDSEHWGRLMREGFLQGSEELRRQLESLQERLEKLEKEFRQQQESEESRKQAT